MLTKLSQVHMDQIAAMRLQAENGEIGYWRIYQTNIRAFFQSSILDL